MPATLVMKNNHTFDQEVTHAGLARHAHGNHSKQPALTVALYMHLFVIGTPTQLNGSIRPGDAQAALERNSRIGDTWDANYWLCQIKATQSMDIFGAASMIATAGKIECKLLITNGTQDLALNAGSFIEFAHALGITPILLTSPCGHLAAGCEPEKVLSPIQKLHARGR